MRSVRCHKARLIFTSASIPLTSRLVARRGRLFASWPIADRPPRMAFSWTRLNTRQRSLPTSSRRRGARSCAGLIGVSGVAEPDDVGGFGHDLSLGLVERDACPCVGAVQCQP